MTEVMSQSTSVGDLPSNETQPCGSVRCQHHRVLRREPQDDRLYLFTPYQVSAMMRLWVSGMIPDRTCDNRADHDSRTTERIMPDLPSGTVTFLFTDIEGSTALWERDRAGDGDRRRAPPRAAACGDRGPWRRAVQDRR